MCLVCRDELASHCVDCAATVCHRQHCDEEWLDDQVERAYRAGFQRAMQTAYDGTWTPRWFREAMLAGANPTDMKLDLERALETT